MNQRILLLSVAIFWGAALLRAEGPGLMSPEERESGWSARIDYFHWNERFNGADFVNEDGPLLTLGYTRRTGIERFRLEMFGGSVNYDSEIMLWNGTTDPLKSTTNYLGLGGEYELLIEPDVWPRISLFAGIGTRFWCRDLPSDYSESGYPVVGYLETWWSTYPYIGLETRRRADDGWEFYGSGRLGCTAINFEHVSYYDVTLYPKAGLMGGFEGGIRGQRLHLAAYFQAFGFHQSAAVRETLQPDSSWLTVGLKAGFSF
ncbi:MAG: hypothetical protein JXB10_05035 [Pirellulales bacterium]|nr:hypothetical protein [Pirellulales bacterium]